MKAIPPRDAVHTVADDITPDSSVFSGRGGSENLLHVVNKVFIVFAMTATLFISALFLVLTGALVARLSLRAKLLPLLRRAR